MEAPAVTFPWFLTLSVTLNVRVDDVIVVAELLTLDMIRAAIFNLTDALLAEETFPAASLAKA